MIKLVATDLDGCLMDARGELPPNFGEAFRKMLEKGVIFAAASGRSFEGVRRPFAVSDRRMPADLRGAEGRQAVYADRMAIISDNGARVCHNGRFLLNRTLPYSVYRSVAEEMRRHPMLLPIVCTEKGAYVEDSGLIRENMKELLNIYYPNPRICAFDDIPEEIIKFALLYMGDIEKDIFPHLQAFDNEKICVQVTAYNWIDVYEKAVSKGTGVAFLQERFDITPEETVVFGDYLNDLSMADHAALSCAPANAHPTVRERFTRTVPSNTEYGVPRTILELLG